MNDIIPKNIEEYFKENPGVGRIRLGNEFNIPQQEARFYCSIFKGTYNKDSDFDCRNTNIKKEQLIKILKSEKYSVEDLSNRLKIIPAETRELLQQLKDEKYNLHIHDGKYELSKELKSSYKRSLNISHWQNNKIKFGFVADTHLGSKYERLDALNLTYDIFQDEGIELVYHGGNFIDGESRFNKYEIHIIGMTPQVEYFINNYPKRENIITKFISGDDHEGWYVQRERINIGEYVQLKAEQANRDDLEYIGHVEVDIELEGIEGNSWIRLMHGGGGSAYALSYTPQKIVESYSGGEKPRVLLLGHYHKLDYCYPREVHVIQMGSFQDQTIWSRKKKIQSHIGGGILEMNQAPDGTINRVKVEFITFFDKGFYKGKDKYWK